MIAAALCVVVGIVAYDLISRASVDFGAVERLWRAVEGRVARPEAAAPSTELDAGAEARDASTGSVAVELSGDTEPVAAISHPSGEDISPAPEEVPTTVVPNGAPPAKAASAGRASPQIQPGRPSLKITTTSGPLDADIISRISRAHLAEVRHCYAMGLQHDPTLRGSLTVVWTITQEGRATGVAVAGPGFDTVVDACTVASVGRWKFPKTREPTAVLGTFKLSPGK